MRWGLAAFFAMALAGPLPAAGEKEMARVLYQTALGRMAAGDYDQARADFRKVLVLDPSHRQASEQLKRLDQLETQTQRAAAERDRLAGVREAQSKGIDLYGKGEMAGALEAFNQVLALDPENFEAARHAVLCRERLLETALTEARAAEKKEDWKSAAARYDGALAHAPTLTEAVQGRERALTRLSETRREESRLFYNSGLEAYLAEDMAKARHLWSQALQKDPDNKEALRGLERLKRK